MRPNLTQVLSILFFLFLSVYEVQSQCNTSPCQGPPSPSVNAQDACVLPSPQSLDCYYGATTPDAPVSFPPSWCSVIHNNHFFAFTANDVTATFSISCYGCASGNGIQAAVLSTSDCITFGFVSPCLGNIPTQTTQILTATGLTPGEVYYLCIDGSGGALCDYSINGSVPTVNGPDDPCLPGDPTSTYTTQATSNWTLNPPTSGNLLTPGTGTQAIVEWTGPGTAEVCAQNALCPNSPVDCIEVTIGENTQTDEFVDLCQGKTTSCAGRTFSSAGTFQVALPSFSGCDSIINCIVNLIPTVFTTETWLLCQGQSVECAGNEYFNPGNFNVTLTGDNGCDSVVTCKIVLLPTYVSPWSLVNLCAPSTYDVCDITFTESGLITETCTSYQGCDSIVNVNLAILNPIANIAPPQVLDCTTNATITLNGSASSVNTAVGGITLYFWSGPGIVGFSNQPNCVVNQPGDYCLVVAHGRGGLYCYDTTCVNVQAVSAVPPVPTLTGDDNPCSNTSVIYSAVAGGFPPATQYNWTTPGNISYTSIAFDSIQIDWLPGGTNGPLCVTAENGCGQSLPACDTIIVQQPLPAPVLTGPATVCAGGGDYLFTIDTLIPGASYFWSVPSGAAVTGSGDTIRVNFSASVSGQVCVQAVNFCDTLTPVCQNVQVSPVPTATLAATPEVCNGETVTLTFTLTGNGPFDVVWSDGAQNLTLTDVTNGHTINLTPSQTTTYSLVSMNDNTAPNVCPGTLGSAQTTNVWQHTSLTLAPELCEGESLFVGGALQTTSGTYVDSLQTFHGCDSVVTTILTVYEIDTLIFNLTTCDPTQDGTVVQNLVQTNGCDSIVITNTALLPSDFITINTTSCDPADVGVFTQNLLNQYGCDSTVVTTVTFALSDTTYLSVGSCDPSQVGTFTDSYIGVDGCDSLIITTVSLLPSNVVNLSGTSCNPNNVGVFTQDLTNQYGCDSTVITTITQFYLDTTFLFTANCDPAATGIFSQTLVTAAGCDSIIVTQVDLLPSNTTFLTGADCDPANVGTFTQVLTNQYGCDSTVITTVSLLPSDQTAIQSTTCDPGAAGIFTYNLTNQYGCDSTVTETVLLLPSNTTNLSFSTCDVAQVGTVTTVLTNQYGCDSTVIATTTLLPANSCSVVASASGTTIPCGATTGSLTITVSVGDAPFTYTVFQNGNQVATGTINALNTPQTVPGLPAGNYTINVTSPNTYDDDATATILQIFPPTVSASVTSDYNGADISCTGENDGAATAVGAGGAGSYTYVWSTGSTTAQATGLIAGTYSVTVSDANLCTATTTVTVSEPAPVEFGFVVSPPDCFGETNGAISVSPMGGVPPYVYALGNGAFQSNPIFNGLSDGTYDVTVMDANGCQEEETLIVNPGTLLTVSLGDDQTIALGENTYIQAIVNIPEDSILSVTWTPPFTDSNCPECLEQEITPLFTTTYSIVVEDINGCTDEDRMTIIVDRRKDIYAPNVFSPNDDGINDIFHLFAKEGLVTNIKSFQIFDRWGDNVFARSDIQPNDPNVGWDGAFRGEKLTPGVYVWFAEITFRDGETILYEGDVTLVK